MGSKLNSVKKSPNKNLDDLIGSWTGKEAKEVKSESIKFRKIFNKNIRIFTDKKN
ncbi:MAG TPA: hypothetical protein VJK05_01370 [archaeon]|nr:hypothetical protein [archaeon]